MSYISQLNLLGDDLPPVSEETLTEELSLWANAQFTFDTPGSSILEDAINESPFDVFSCLADLNDINHVQHISLMQSVQSAQSSTRTFPTLLPRIAPAPTNPTFGDHSAVMQKKPKEPIRKKSVEKIVAAEDKRKRNTAASARFRMKKKMKEHDLEKQTTEMIQKTEELEAHVRELEKEIKWLRELVVEKNSSLLKGSKPETINE